MYQLPFSSIRFNKGTSLRVLFTVSICMLLASCMAASMAGEDQYSLNGEYIKNIIDSSAVTLFEYDIKSSRNDITHTFKLYGSDEEEFEIEYEAEDARIQWASSGSPQTIEYYKITFDLPSSISGFPKSLNVLKLNSQDLLFNDASQRAGYYLFPNNLDPIPEDSLKLFIPFNFKTQNLTHNTPFFPESEGAEIKFTKSRSDFVPDFETFDDVDEYFSFFTHAFQIQNENYISSLQFIPNYGIVSISFYQTGSNNSELIFNAILAEEPF